MPSPPFFLVSHAQSRPTALDTLAAAQMDSHPTCGLGFLNDCELGQLFILNNAWPLWSFTNLFQPPFNLSLLDDLIERTCSFSCKCPTLCWTDRDICSWKLPRGTCLQHFSAVGKVLWCLDRKQRQLIKGIAFCKIIYSPLCWWSTPQSAFVQSSRVKQLQPNPIQLK